MSSDKLLDIISLNIYSKILNYDSYYYLIISHKYKNNKFLSNLITNYLKNINYAYKNINIDIINDYNKQLFDKIYNIFLKKHSLSHKFSILNHKLNQSNEINNKIYKYDKTISTKQNIINIIDNINNNFIFPFSLSIKKIKNKSLYIHTNNILDFNQLTQIKSNIFKDNKNNFYEHNDNNYDDFLVHDINNYNRIYNDNLIPNYTKYNKIYFNKKHDCYYRKQHKYLKIINFLNNFSNKYRLFNIYTDDKNIYFSLYPLDIINKYYTKLRQIYILINKDKYDIIDNIDFILFRLDESFKKRHNHIYGNDVSQSYNNNIISSFIKNNMINSYNRDNISIYRNKNENIDNENIIKLFNSYLNIDIVEEYYNFVGKQVAEISNDDINIKYCEELLNNKNIDNKKLNYDYIPEIKYNKDNKKQGLVGDLTVINNSYNNLNFINPLDDDYIKQKTNIYCLLNRNMLYPIRYIYNESHHEFFKLYDLNENSYIIGMINIKLYNYYDIYIFIIKNKDGTYTYITHDLFIINPKLSLNNSYNWIIICLNIIKYYSKNLKKQLYIYKIKNKENEYLFSYKSLDEISKYYDSIKNNNNKYELDNELQNLIEYDIDIGFSKKSLIIKQKTNQNISSNYHILNNISQIFNIYNNNTNYIEYYQPFNILLHKDIIIKNKSNYLLNPIYTRLLYI